MSRVYNENGRFVAVRCDEVGCRAQRPPVSVAPAPDGWVRCGVARYPAGTIEKYDFCPSHAYKAEAFANGKAADRWNQA